MPPPAVRVSDNERERVVAVLRQHCTDGLLTLDEFSDRVGIVYGASSTLELEQVTVDLPSLEPAPLQATAATPATRRRRGVEWTVSLFGGNQRRGRWRIEGETNALSIMGGCHLDLREVEVVGHEAVVNCYAFMGGVDVVVPEGIDVVLEGFSFMGGKSAKIADVPVIPGSPLIRVRAFSFMGGVNVRSKPASTGRKSRQRDRDRDHRHRNRALPGMDPPSIPAPRAAEAMRDARLTVVPRKSSASRMASPVWRPMRTRIGSSGCSRFHSRWRFWIAMAQRSARLALEKATMKPSPWTFTSKPPCWASSSRTRR